jgi:hypothetical protein
MKLRILPAAVADLHRGRDFYARQADSVGDYFLDSLFSDIDSLELYAAYMSNTSAIIGCSPSGFLLPSITKWTGMSASCGVCWIAARIRRRLRVP